MMHPVVHLQLPAMQQIQRVQDSYYACAMRSLCFGPNQSRKPSGGSGCGLTGTATETACRDSSILATRFPSRILAMCSSSVLSATETACHLLPSAGERVVGRALFGTGARSDDPIIYSRATDFKVTLCVERGSPGNHSRLRNPSFGRCGTQRTQLL